MQSPVRTAAAAAAIAGAGLAGFGLTSAFAQEDTGDDPTTTTEAPADDAARPGGPGCAGGASLDTMAEAIGIDVEELRAALEDGQTPAEVAEANDVSRADLIDAIVAEMAERIHQAVEDGHLTEAVADERRAELEDNAAAIADGERPEGFGPPGGPPPGIPQDDAAAEDTATAAEDTATAA